MFFEETKKMWTNLVTLSLSSSHFIIIQVRTALADKLAWLNKFNESIVNFDKTLAELGNIR